jgi:hypothetical protein
VATVRRFEQQDVPIRARQDGRPAERRRSLPGPTAIRVAGSRWVGDAIEHRGENLGGALRNGGNLIADRLLAATTRPPTENEGHNAQDEAPDTERQLDHARMIEWSADSAPNLIGPWRFTRIPPAQQAAWQREATSLLPFCCQMADASRLTATVE